jgi:hypothetical protein
MVSTYMMRYMMHAPPWKFGGLKRISNTTANNVVELFPKSKAPAMPMLRAA